MSYRELSMIEVKEVLRRREAGQALREIARETGLDRKTVRRYVEAAGETDGEVERQKARGQAVASVLLGNAPPSGANEGEDGAAKQRSDPRERKAGKQTGEAASTGDPGHAQRADVRE